MNFDCLIGARTRTIAITISSRLLLPLFFAEHEGGQTRGPKFDMVFDFIEVRHGLRIAYLWHIEAQLHVLYMYAP